VLEPRSIFEPFVERKDQRRAEKQRAFAVLSEITKRLSPTSQTVMLRQLLDAARRDPDLRETTPSLPTEQLEVAPTLDELQAEAAGEFLESAPPAARQRLGADVLRGFRLRQGVAPSFTRAIEVARAILGSGQRRVREEDVSALAERIFQRDLAEFEARGGVADGMEAIGQDLLDVTDPLTASGSLPELPPPAPVPASRQAPRGSPLARQMEQLEQTRDFPTASVAQPAGGDAVIRQRIRELVARGLSDAEIKQRLREEFGLR
jgi:hypothetical protein